MTAPPDGAAQLRSLGLSLLAAFALLAAAILRLERAPRPRATVLARWSGGRYELAEVSLARRGMAPLVLGRALRCDGREVLARTGSSARLQVLSEAPEGLRVEAAERGGAQRFRVRSDCVVVPEAP